SVQNLEAVTFEHFFAAPALEGNYLTADAFFAGTIEVAQISTHERARGRNFSRLCEQIDMKMGYPPRPSWNFAPAIHQQPPNETTRALVIPEITRQRPEK